MKSKLERMKMGQAGVNIRFIPHQSEEAMKVLGPDYRPGRPETAFLIKPSGEILYNLEAFLPFVPNLPGGKFLLWMLRFPLARPLAEWSYRIIARHRYRWFGEITSV
jgi:predicted DCC family thiol-disulfide oxidoreductase YuxK